VILRELVIRVEHAKQRSDLLSFLREQRANPRQLDECSIALDLDDGDCPPLATLVAALDEMQRRAETAAGHARTEPVSRPDTRHEPEPSGTDAELLHCEQISPGDNRERCDARLSADELADHLDSVHGDWAAASRFRRRFTPRQDVMTTPAPIPSAGARLEQFSESVRAHNGWWRFPWETAEKALILEGASSEQLEVLKDVHHTARALAAAETGQAA